MGRKIVTTGRGVAGKATFTASSTSYLQGSLLLIDIAPDQSLADMLGIDLEKEGVRTVLDILFDIQKKQGHKEPGSMPLPEKSRVSFYTRVPVRVKALRDGASGC